MSAEKEMTALKEDTAESEATVVRDHQAVNRRTLVDDMTVLTTTIMMTMMTVTIAADMSNIAIAIMTDDGMIPAPRAITEEEHADLVNRAIHPHKAFSFRDYFCGSVYRLPTVRISLVLLCG